MHGIALGEVGHLGGAGLTVLLTVEPHHFVDVALDVGLEMRPPARDLALGKVAIAIIVRLELTAVDRDACPLQRADPAAKLYKTGACPADGGTVATPKVGDGLVIRHQPAGQPHHLDVPSSLGFQPAV